MFLKLPPFDLIEIWYQPIALLVTPNDLNIRYRVPGLALKFGFTLSDLKFLKRADDAQLFYGRVICLFMLSPSVCFLFLILWEPLFTRLLFDSILESYTKLFKYYILQNSKAIQIEHPQMPWYQQDYW